jgi:hypothetical protein
MRPGQRHAKVLAFALLSVLERTDPLFANNTIAGLDRASAL